MKNSFFYLFFLLASICIYSQRINNNPLGFESILSGTFGELRSNHFHSGLDIKTKGKEGAKVFSVNEGYVSRIKISRGGYGKAIYIKHLDGTTSVYAHLQKFSSKIDSIVKKLQYKNENYEIEFFPAVNEINISNNEIIAYSGNTGGSSGPHLHFEIRDINQKPLNPLDYGINVTDTKAPNLKALKLYKLDKNSEILSSRNLSFYKLSNNKYITDTIYDTGDIGFGVQAFDRQDLANNKNGIYKLNTFINLDTILKVAFNKFSFDETKHINRLIDYSEFKKNKKRFIKLFIQENNPLSVFKKELNKGVIELKRDSSYIFRIELVDFNNNLAEIIIPIKEKESKTKNIDAEVVKIEDINKKFININKKYFISKNNSSISIDKESFYSSIFLKIDSKIDTLTINSDTIPLIKSLRIKFKKTTFNNSYIGKLIKKSNKSSFVSSNVKGDSIVAYTKSLGTYILARDTINPTINPLGFNKNDWISDLTYLKFQIKDKQTGIKNYRATINGKWILMEPFNKNGVIRYNFDDNISNTTKNIFNLEVSDNVGNTSFYETVFYRKTN
jgi:hypothetical protein